ncbi:MAG TPA: YdeI/OmpD-associated family protein [Rhodothermales bacterium]
MLKEDGYQAFAGPVLRAVGDFPHHYVPLPVDVADALSAAGATRVRGTLNGIPFRRAVQGRPDGERHLMFGRAFLRDAGAEQGDMVVVELWPDPDPNRVDLCEELRVALEHDPEAANRFHAMTPGRRRSMDYYVTSAKRPETRIKRALELAHELRTCTLHSDRSSGS